MFAKKTLIASLFGFALAVAVPAHAESQNPEGTNNQAETSKEKEKSPAERRADARENAKKTLAEVYAKYPEAKDQIEKAAGYATFKTGGVQVVFAGGAGGDGVAVHNGKETFMTVGQIKAGLGLGAKESRLLLVFTSEKAFNKFIKSGWAFSGDATAAAKAGKSGGAVSGASLIAPEVYAYQITANGLTAEVTVAGTKFSVSKKLNSGK
ncbi:hypothetical protein IGB42_00788 [Andreprevotia sp. IGB-42]|uniref:lipid-binding SYLF domain-containing protein n=1 Tax=Andreprevotia sp. IGB-42 TaxID=2497473 RepID=UPI00135C7B63|nr:YSC84-related protein [Andreprevotia sp. IGB-42]KAF0814733.1 hypothetical protein IGB42_00788 [Andreprevotia sp. IGB-42]